MVEHGWRDRNENLTDKATYERLEKDVTAVKNDISALTDQSPTCSIRSPAPQRAGAPRLTRKPAPMSIRWSTICRNGGSAMMDAARTRLFDRGIAGRLSLRSARLQPLGSRSALAS